MGAVHKGRDVDLGRDLAVKVLLERYRDDDELLARFIEEAQIGGQLQHPGIVPIYELGKFSDRRPYFAMKLVQGRTLAALLAERKDLRGTGILPVGHPNTGWKPVPLRPTEDLPPRTTTSLASSPSSRRSARRSPTPTREA
jgi:serine/threonine protein kinase